jgi:EmrB/QacA subfamily drug resistance transporter
MTPNPQHQRRGLVLGVIAIAQLMVVLDLTIVNIALPAAQRDLGFSDDLRQWVVTAYALAFGSLLLLGGRLGDLFGRKWTFVAGLVGFAAASAIGAAAGSFGVLVSARAAQGVFGALLAPSALALLTTTFTDPRERAKAFGVYSALSGSGAAIGLLLGGVFTEALSWRWCLYVNLLFALPAAVGATRLLVNQPQANRPSLDLPGAVTATLGLLCVVYGFSNSETESWGHPVTIVMLAAGAVLLAGFVAIEARVAHPLLPLGVLRDRTRGGAYLALGLTYMAVFAVFLFLTYYLQRTKGFSAVEAGVAYLPMTATIMATTISVNVAFLRRVGPRPLLTVGMLLGAGAMVWLAQLSPSSSYAAHILPALIVLGLGYGNVVAAGIATATRGVEPHHSGVASALVGATQQVGGSIGTAVLSSIFAGAVTAYAQGRPHTPQLPGDAAVHGYTVAFWVAAAVFGAGALAVGVLMRRPREARHTAGRSPRARVAAVAADTRHGVSASTAKSALEGPPAQIVPGS